MSNLFHPMTLPAWLWGAFAFLLLGAPVRAQQSSVPVLPQAYRLTPGDTLSISVLGHEDKFNSPATISPDGMISYIGIGKPVPAAGLTVSELTTMLTAGLHGQLKHPQVTVLVTQTHPRQVSVIGQGVRLPNVFAWHPGMTLLEAVASSGGASQAPELTDAILVSGPSTHVIDLVALIEQGDQSQNVALQPGDILLMSPRDPAKAEVTIVGQVVKAGPVAVPPGGATVSSVINLAGGATTLAALSRVQVQHGDTVQTLNLHPLLFDINDPVGQTRVVAGDVVNVPLNDNTVQVFGEINQPGLLLIPDGKPLTVTRALALRGGPTREADQRTIGIVRRDASGQEHAYSVNTQDILSGRGKGRDVVLLPGDNLVVPKRHQGFTGLGALQTAIGTLFGVRALGTLLH